jgi:RNA polymerase sigma-70 factor (ECF subfamily)
MTDESTAPDGDRADVRASLDGDGDAYGRLVQRYQGEVASWLWRFTRDRTTLEDLAQETFVQAYVSLRTFKATGAFGAWLRRIATRVGYRFWRQQRGRRVRNLGASEAPGTSPDPTDAQNQRWAIEDVLAKLTARDRLVVQLRYIEDRPVAEVAELTGWSQTMVKVQSYRARKRLRKLLAQMGLEIE